VEKAATVTLIPSLATPLPQTVDLPGADLVLRDYVDGRLRTYILHAKCPKCRGLGGDQARLGVFAALNARRAILESQTLDGWKPAVAEFAQTWLGVRSVTERWLEATSTALLGDWVALLDEHLLEEAGPLSVTTLKTEATQVHRQLVPLWEHKVRGRELLSLDKLTPGGATLADLVTDRTALTPDFPSDVEAVLDLLTIPEQAVAHAYALNGRGTWSEAAEVAGATSEEAESVRRKLLRLGKQYDERRTSARTTRNLLRTPGTVGAAS
jgi:hypothetical protein